MVAKLGNGVVTILHFKIEPGLSLGDRLRAYLRQSGRDAFLDIERELPFAIFELLLFAEKVGLCCLDGSQFGTKISDAQRLQSRSLPFGFTFVLDLLTRTGGLLVRNVLAFNSQLSLYLIPHRASHLLLLLQAGFLELSGTLLVGKLLFCYQPFLFRESVGLHLKLLFVLQAGGFNQRCGERFGEWDWFAAVRAGE